MPLKIYNSLTGEKEVFVPLEAGVVKMYVCGPTVYDEPHVGHLRSAWLFEMMRRYFEFSDFKVRFVRNVTDVDDKIIEKARLASDCAEETKNVAARYYDLYAKDLQRLGIRPPDSEPRATEHIGDMIGLIEKLIERKIAYAVEGDVYFAVNAFNRYGQLSHQKIDALLQGVRMDPSQKKRQVLDFSLWKMAKPGEPSWPSPWGEGRPGWHIECSAMSMKYLGESFDIHGGGRDLIFPHHENEIAQSESVTGKAFARFWIHHGLVTRDTQKMSKSLGNFVTLNSIIAKNPRGAEDLKFLFLSTHYSAPLDYTDENMKMAHAVRERFAFFFEEVKGLKSRCLEPKRACVGDWEVKFREAMNDDFNTSQALSLMHEMIHEARQIHEPSGMMETAGLLKKFGKLFGIFEEPSALAQSLDEDEKIVEKIEARAMAKKNKDFILADEIRDELLKKGIALTDLTNGQAAWRRI